MEYENEKRQAYLMEKSKLNKLLEMKLHSTMDVSSKEVGYYTYAQRVPGGWNYVYQMPYETNSGSTEFRMSAVFVPLSVQP